MGIQIYFPIEEAVRVGLHVTGYEEEDQWINEEGNYEFSSSWVTEVLLPSGKILETRGEVFWFDNKDVNMDIKEELDRLGIVYMRV